MDIENRVRVKTTFIHMNEKYHPSVWHGHLSKNGLFVLEEGFIDLGHAYYDWSTVPDVVVTPAQLNNKLGHYEKQIFEMVLTFLLLSAIAAIAVLSGIV